jgi:acyl-CoA reductase-like NAD-dependent aldehyde dehydrogenase
MSLLEAGLPEDALAFFPGTHELVDTITQATALTVVFGGQEIADRYARDNHVKVYGPGRSKAVVLANADFKEAVDTIYHLIMDDGGRGCINCSAVIVEGNAQELADAVSARLKQIPVISPLEESALLGAMTNTKEAESYNSLIDSRLSPDAQEWSAIAGGRITKIGDVTLMLPTVIEVPSFAHPLFGIELPFPFAVFTSANSREEILLAAQHSLAVVVVGEDEDFSQELLLEPSIDKVFVSGALSTELDPREPHEGFILDFLFQKKAFQAGKMLEQAYSR